MKPVTSDSKPAKYLMWGVIVILGLIPFHAFLTVWLASAIGHYLEVRLWKEYLLIILAAGSAYLLGKNPKLRSSFFSWRLSKLIFAYTLVSLVWGAAAYFLNGVTLKALAYGLTVNLRFLLFFLVVWIIAASAPRLKRLWSRILLWPAFIVTVFAILQRLALPLDFLKHFGYNQNTIYPYETINHNSHYPRVMSTLRGANPLGAYLNLIISAAAVMFLSSKKRLAWAVLGLLSIAALFFSYSREAWLGALVSVAALAFLNLKSQYLKKLALIAAGLLIVVAGVLGFALRHNSTFENLFLHTQSGSNSLASSNQQHISAFRSGLHDATHNPIGDGVGTAGPASVYNNGKSRIAENYFIQVAQETGWLGLALFLAINVLAAQELWRARSDKLALSLLVSLAGISLINLFSHAWTDDTLAYLWWGLAGIALAPAILDIGIKNGSKNKKPS